MIPEAAVEAARVAVGVIFGEPANSRDMAHVMAILEAAAPHMLAEVWESGYTLGYADCANKQESNRPNPHEENR